VIAVQPAIAQPPTTPSHSGSSPFASLILITLQSLHRLHENSIKPASPRRPPRRPLQLTSRRYCRRHRPVVAQNGRQSES